MRTIGEIVFNVVSFTLPGMCIIPMGAKPLGLRQNSFPVLPSINHLAGPVSFFQKNGQETPIHLELSKTWVILTLP